MTLAEKLGQLQQLDGEADGRFRPEHLELARKGSAWFDFECARRTSKPTNCRELRSNNRA
ncbi:MAG: hypothetical protein WKF71_05465 [Pyrinomonadaceae bacterium]